MRDTLPQTSKRMNDIERQAAEQFDTPILHNRVYEAIGEADEVRQFVDVAERAYELDEDGRYVGRIQRVAFGAAEELNDEIDDVVDAAIASECAAVIEDARDGWFDDHAEREDIDAAFSEAKQWLAEHGDAACDAGVDIKDVAWGDEGDETEEVAADV